MALGTEGWGSFRAEFAAQFERDAEGVIFRSRGKGPAIRISENERDSFTDAYDAHLKKLRWMVYLLAIPPVAICIAVAIWLEIEPGSTWFSVMLFSAMALGTGVLVVINRRAFRAPERLLSHRIPIADKLSAAEARRNALHAAAAVLVFFYATEGPRSDFWVGWNKLWVIGGAAFVVLLVVQALRKWRVEGGRLTLFEDQER